MTESRVDKILKAQFPTEKKSESSHYPNDKRTKRILAPFLSIVRKNRKEINDDCKSSSLRKFNDLQIFFIDLLPKLYEIIDIIKIITKASNATLYLLDYPTNKIYQSFKNNETNKIIWPIYGSGIVAAFVAKRKQYVLVDDILTDQRFPDGIGYHDETIKSVLCVPVLTPDGNDCFAVIQLIKHHDHPPFDENDLKITQTQLEWIGIAIQQYQQKLIIKQQKELNDYLLNLTSSYFTDNLSIEKIISEIIKFAKTTLKAEHGSFYILDKDNDDLIGDLYDESIDNTDDLHKKTKKIHFDNQLGGGVVGLVATTGEIINIKDANEDARFNHHIDTRIGLITKAIICIPILSNENVLGVIQIINKKNGSYFTIIDEDLLKIIANYCTLILHHFKIITQNKRTMHVSNVYMKILKTQWQPCIHDIEEFVQNPIEIIPPENFDSFDYYITPDLDNEMPQLCLYMYLQLINPIYINRDNLMKFILSVRRLYRNENDYHNFKHAFNVCHCMYNILDRNLERFSLIELEALLIAALCHDIDHVGYTNDFLKSINDDLSQLYEESILENHHYHLTLLLLNDYQIFNNFNDDEFKLFLTEIKNAILATDLIEYFKNRNKLQQIIDNNCFDWNQNCHKQLIKAIIMNCCDLSGCCKPYTIAKKIIDNLYNEFYNQGDEEIKLGLHPLPIMDRNQQNRMPEDQNQFLTIIVIPCVDLLKQLLPNTERLYQNAINLHKAWQEIIETRNMKTWQQDDSIVHYV